MKTLRVSANRRIQKLLKTNELLNDQLDIAEREKADLAALILRLSRAAPPELAQEAIGYLMSKGLLDGGECRQNSGERNDGHQDLQR